MAQDFTISVVRGICKDRGYRLWKVRESSRDYATYGPFSLVDIETNTVVAAGLPDTAAVLMRVAPMHEVKPRYQGMDTTNAAPLIQH